MTHDEIWDILHGVQQPSERCKGKTPLHGRPLDEDGKIEFQQPSATTPDVEKIAKALKHIEKDMRRSTTFTTEKDVEVLRALAQAREPLVKALEKAQADYRRRFAMNTDDLKSLKTPYDAALIGTEEK